MNEGRIAVIGGGAWGTALAVQAARQGHPTVLWAREPDVVDAITKERENTVFLPGVKLPDGLSATTSTSEALAGAELVMLVPPSKYFRAVTASLAGEIPDDALVVIATKGIEEDTHLLMTEVLSETAPRVGSERVGVLSGPSFAKEVGQGLPTDVVIAAESQDLARRVQALLHSPEFRVYASADRVGVQVGGALKNVMAVAIGAADGLGFGLNARSALITRGLAEIVRLGVALGAEPLTFLGMSGVGDLVLTCTGDLSRNRQLGQEVARGTDPQAYLASRRTVAEGFWTAKAAHDLSRLRDVEMPITEQAYLVLHEGKPLLEAAKTLMTRDYKDELWGIRDVW